MPMSETVEMLQAILGTIDEGIHVVDADGITIFYNHVASKLDGLTPDEVLGKPLLEVFPSLDRHSSTLLTVIAGGEPIYNKPQTYTNWRGVRVETVNTTLPVRVGRRLVGAVEVAKDIGKLKELSEKLMDLQAKISRPRKGKRSQKGNGDGLSFHFSDILTRNERMHQLIDRARRAARTSSPVLIYGETGTGKELFVQSIHQASARRSQPFIAQNCAALPATLLESLLFGTTKGSFTGADDRPGLFELADGGTLFLDELNSMPLDLQAKLLRALQDGEIRRIGSSHAVRVDVRVIAAVNEPPQRLVQSGAMRTDLYYRINVVSFELPPLRERREDVEMLTAHFLDKYNRRFQMQVGGISEEVAALFSRYDWPGNVRELEHVIEAAMNMVEAELIEKEHLPQHLLDRVSGLSSAVPGLARGAVNTSGTTATGERTLPDVLRRVEEQMIAEAMRETDGNILRAAKLLGIPRQTLQYKLSQLGGMNR
ncbi:sigma 54-interacting transcriptional regulator [Brevibacillus ruminantium]|uniref:Sigma 54-interacting transcriptional regulator n=1 Tax=Brevibacillus ruminantium TaxID=2950604 RepID=A0ABY4WFE6_9BACL|nr:sigma 54-interacting transcriptional regulator [Brevibacillus ruminantium]USG65459.1 sigma 54-interacting transcriptional regulator [Brevibacillus ruminantium]